MNKTCLLPLSLVTTLFLIGSISASAAPIPKHEQLVSRTHKLEKQIEKLEEEIHDVVIGRKKLEERQTVLEGKFPVVAPDQKNIFLLFGTPVVSSPYLGFRSEYDGHDLIVNIASINEDLRLLKQRKKTEDYMTANHIDPVEHPVVEISGKLQGLVLGLWRSGKKSTGDVDLSGVEIDFMIAVNPWSTGFISLEYDNSPPTLSGQRIANSRFFNDKAFLVLGNLNRLPFYFTIGQFILPFGRYYSHMLSSPLTQRLARTKARAVLLGYQQPGETSAFHASVFGFRSDSGMGDRAQGGANLGYEYESGALSADAGISYISTLADAEGMQITGGTGFTGFAAAENIMHRVAGITVHGRLAWHQWSVLGEFVNSLRRFSSADLLHSGSRARPMAANLEANVNFELFGKSSSLSAGYGYTDDTYPLNLPRRRYVGAFNINLFRDTIESIEFRHDRNYGTSTTGAGLTAPPTPTAVSNNPGEHSNLLTAQVSFYF